MSRTPSWLPATWWILAVALPTLAQEPASESELIRGEYLVHAGGCISCHTADHDGAIALAGGHKLDSDFGTFYAPNITPDAETGIGSWSDDEFDQAVRRGIAPDGSAYFPAFPYTSYAGMTRADALAIKRYLFSIEPVRQENQQHELAWYLGVRLSARVWQALFFRPESFAPDPDRNEAWNRGAYLVRHLGHCGECHSPRNGLGKIDSARELAGGTPDAKGNSTPNITPHEAAGIGSWSQDEIEFFLELGMLPDGDFTGGNMSAVIDDNTSKLSAADREAIALYLKSVPAIDSTE